MSLRKKDFHTGIRVAALWRGVVAALAALIAIACFVCITESRELLGFDYVAWMFSLPAVAVMVVTSDIPKWRLWTGRAVMITYGFVVAFCLLGRWYASFGVDAGVASAIYNLLMAESLPAHLAIYLTVKVWRRHFATQSN